jgi:zinc transport system substrate-binding protein
MQKLPRLTPFTAIVILIAIGAITYGIAILEGRWAAPIETQGPAKTTVVTTLFPVYDMARSIGGNDADVSLLLPPGVEPHTFEPKPTDIVRINEASVFIYTSSVMEPWAVKVVSSVTNPHLRAVDASSGTTMIPAVFHDADEPVGTLDPHIWLDFDNAKIMARNILQALVASNPAAADRFREREQNYERSLDALDYEYRASLSSCKQKEIVYAGHYAFGYMAKRYGFTYLAAQGVSPDAEPTANDLTKLVDQIHSSHLSYVFYEELTSPKIAETIASETGAKLLLLNAAHNVSKDEVERGTTFFDILREDLDNLKIGLSCTK